ncbi:MAG: hypothetical protein ABSH08_00540 [Tepidisphaeraceae bacterium]|jgi:hypothetical protein
MIAAEQRKHLEELRSRVACRKKFVCIDSALTELCEGHYHGDIDVMECLDPSQPPCNLSSMSGCMRVCNCPLRKYIAQHFSDWAAESTWMLGPTREN